jgi:riboflavin biosynthesis pyrimidine reductase
MLEPGVDRAAVEHVVVVDLRVRVELRVQVHGDARHVEDALHQHRVAVLRHALVLVVEVVVVVVEAHRQALQDAGRQFARLQAPLLDGVGLEEGFVQLAADEAQRLLFEGGRVLDRLVAERSP